MVKRCMDQKIRALKFEARNERIETGILVKTRQGKNVSVEKETRVESRQECVQMDNACSFRYDEGKRGKVTCSFNTRNFLSIGNVFEDLLAPNEQTAACLVNVRSVTDTHCELAAKEDDVERNIQNFAKLTPRSARMFSNRNLHSHAEGACPQKLFV